MIYLENLPKRIIVTNNESEKEILKIEENFFNSLRNYLDKKYPQELNYYEITKDNFFDKKSRISYMKYNEKVVASVLKTKTTLGETEYVFFRNLEEINTEISTHNIKNHLPFI